MLLRAAEEEKVPWREEAWGTGVCRGTSTVICVQRLRCAACITRGQLMASLREGWGRDVQGSGDS